MYTVLTVAESRRGVARPLVAEFFAREVIADVPGEHPVTRVPTGGGGLELWVRCEEASGPAGAWAVQVAAAGHGVPAHLTRSDLPPMPPPVPRLPDPAEPLIYDRARHGGHNRLDPRYADVGHDVVRSTWQNGGAGPVRVQVVATVDGGHGYMAALDLAKRLRRGEDQYGWTACRYACGCRWAATTADITVVTDDPFGLAEGTQL
jgi:hypothetical protein